MHHDPTPGKIDKTTKEFIVNEGYAHMRSGDLDFDATYGGPGCFVNGTFAR